MVAIGRYEYSSSDEECGVPPVPVGSDDGTVLFFWAAEGPVTVACVTVLRGRIPRQKDSARNPCFGLLFWTLVLDPCFGPLFWTLVLDPCLGSFVYLLIFLGPFLNLVKP